MSNILFATVPFSGHINPGIPIASALVKNGHKVRWYSGSSFRSVIESTGAEFFQFTSAPDFNDKNVRQVFKGIPENNHARQAIFYIKNIFFSPMKLYYEELKKIDNGFNAELIITDEWFTGAIPFAEEGEKKWISYGNSPLMYVSKNYPGIGTGVMPDNSIYGRNRDRLIYFIQKTIFYRTQNHINRIRKEIGLAKLDDFFLNHNYKISAYHLKFNTEAFEFPTENIPDSIKFVGPVISDNINEITFNWLDDIYKTRPLVFITGGSHDISDVNKLIIPSIIALKLLGIPAIVSTGKQPVDIIPKNLLYDGLIVEEYIPYSLIMPFIDLMITNGGFGGVSTALRYGVPVIVAGNSEDKPEIASRVQYSGCGINLKTGKPSVSRLKKAISEILNDSSYSIVSMKISKDFSEKDAVKDSVNIIEDLLMKT